MPERPLLLGKSENGALVGNPRLAAPVRSMGTIIHRDRTFEFNGQTYQAINGGPGWGYEVVTYPDLRHVADGFFTLAEVRAYVDKARREGWEHL